MGAPSQNSPLMVAVVSLRAMSGKETIDDLVKKVKLSHPTTQSLTGLACELTYSEPNPSVEGGDDAHNHILSCWLLSH